MNQIKSILAVMLVAGAILWGTALLPAAPVRADLPERATPTPTVAPDNNGKSDRSGPPPGAYIELHPSAARAGMWAVVQWQDSAGNWRDVEGWRGEIANSSRWWVAAKDFGTGPFRWMVKEGPVGAGLGQSEPFQLPAGANQTTRVTVLVAK